MNEFSPTTMSNTTLLTTMSNTTLSTTMPNTTLSTIISSTTTTSLMLKNETIYNLIKNLLNKSELYEHQVADLIEPEKNSVRGIHALIWTITILTYLLAIPMVIRMYRSRAYQNVIDYFSFHLIICAFIAWIPVLIFLLYHWFQLFTLKFCRLHYVILSTNETVPLFFVLYMIIERFFYAHPSLKQKFSQCSRMYFIHLYAISTWFVIMFVYAFASPFDQRDLNSPIGNLTRKFCPYSYSKLSRIATVRSIIYFCLLVPALVFIVFVLRYFYQMRGTNQILPIQKFWTIRVTALLCVLVFYDIYLYYLEHVAETYRSFLLSSLLRSTFYVVQILTILLTEPYWIEVVYERCLCLCCICIGRRRKTTIPVAVPIETEITTFPFSSSAGHYSLVDDTFADEFDQATNVPEPTLRVIA